MPHMTHSVAFVGGQSLKCRCHTCLTRLRLVEAGGTAKMAVRLGRDGFEDGDTLGPVYAPFYPKDWQRCQMLSANNPPAAIEWILDMKSVLFEQHTRKVESNSVQEAFPSWAT
eukprot:1780891-Amphidinium_carterae.4